MVIKNYSLRELFILTISKIRSCFVIPSARLIRFPIFIRGQRYISWGHNLTTGHNCRIEVIPNTKYKLPRLSFGRNVQLNESVHICVMGQVKIGNDVLVASNVYISDNSHGLYKGTFEDTSPMIPPIDREYFINPTIINDRVWIGEGSIIMPGVTIGEGCIIGAHSLVNKSIPKNSIAVGSPAKVIKQFDMATNRWRRID